MKEEEILNEAIKTFGKKRQLLKCAEECNELARELVRYASGRKAYIEKEITDVEITIAQVKKIIGYNDCEFFDPEEEKEYKLKKLRTAIAIEKKRQKSGDSNAGP